MGVSHTFWARHAIVTQKGLKICSLVAFILVKPVNLAVCIKIHACRCGLRKKDETSFDVPFNWYGFLFIYLFILQMKLVFPLLVVLLVSTDAKFPDFGKLFGKLPYKKINIPSIAEKIRTKLPFLKSGAESPKSYVEPTGKKSPPTFCGSHDCPHFYEVKLNATDYTLRCYPESYRWVSTTVTGKVLMKSWGEGVKITGFLAPLS